MDKCGLRHGHALRHGHVVLYASTVCYGMRYARKPRSLPFSLASLISEVRSVLGVCFTNASKSTISSLADRRLLVMIVLSWLGLGLGSGSGIRLGLGLGCGLANLLVLDEYEAERVQRGAYLLAVERAILVPVHVVVVVVVEGDWDRAL